MTIREELELREMAYLSPYAVLSKNSKGRKRKEPDDRRTGTWDPLDQYQAE